MQKTVGVNPKLQWRPQEIGDEECETFAKERLSTSKGHGKTRGAWLHKAFGLTSCHHVSYIQGMALWDLMFVLLGFDFGLI